MNNFIVEHLSDSITICCGDSILNWPLDFTADTIITDPPYGMSFQSNHRLVKHNKIYKDHNDEALLWATKLAANHSKYIFCRWDNIHSVSKPKSLITWVKNNWSMGDLKHEHARQTETILFYPGVNHKFPLKRPTDVVDARRTQNKLHPTEKPVELIRQIIKWTEGTVYDPFMGSGTTGVACVLERRSFVGIEINPDYYSTAKARILEAINERNETKANTQAKDPSGAPA